MHTKLSVFRCGLRYEEQRRHGYRHQADVNDERQMGGPGRVLHQHTREQRSQAQAAGVGDGGHRGRTSPPCFGRRLDDGDGGGAGEKAR
ncbi:Uncharacterised protein [Mycobacteroides abscessus subsp. massiliense]|nr:Uncharacterised protein [Mycobacteroides abscessus subsp. massiliense]